MFNVACEVKLPYAILVLQIRLGFVPLRKNRKKVRKEASNFSENRRRFGRSVGRGLNSKGLFLGLFGISW